MEETKKENKKENKKERKKDRKHGGYFGVGLLDTAQGGGF